MSDMHIILIDDDRDLLTALSEAYELANIKIKPFQNPVKALKSIHKGLTGAVVTDVRMPEMDGIELFKKVRDIDSKIPVILITGHADVPMVLSMLKEGVFDFLSKPLNIEDLIATSLRALDTRSLVLENRELRKLADRAIESEELIGESASIIQLRDIIRQVAKANVDVLIEGETGTERLIVAKLLHRLSGQSNNPFVKINCAALSLEGAASKLFGHGVSGTASYNRRLSSGKIEAANRGMLFLDKIDHMPPPLQGQMLGVVENREVTPVGDIRSKKLDLRIVASCTQNLSTLVESRDFNSDLYFRLNTVKLSLPPLRERSEDIPLLFAHFLSTISEDLGKKIPRIKADTRKYLYDHDWPGNIRELKNYAQAVILGINNPDQNSKLNNSSLPQRVRQFEAATIKASLRQTKGAVSQTITQLKIPRKTFYDKIKKYNIDLSKYRD